MITVIYAYVKYITGFLRLMLDSLINNRLINSNAVSMRRHRIALLLSDCLALLPSMTT